VAATAIADAKPLFILLTSFSWLQGLPLTVERIATPK